MSKYIIFDHIPKTAGTSILSALKSIFPDFINIIYHESEAYHDNALEKYKDSSFGGHLQFQYSNILSKNHYYCTILRDPVERFISQYFFNIQEGLKTISTKDLKHPNLLDPQVIGSLKHSLSKYINQESLKYSYNNLQALHFAARMCKDPQELNEKQLIDAAISSLEGYHLIGNFNQLNDFIHTITQDFNKPHLTIEKHNITNPNKNRDKIEDAILQKIYDCNLADYSVIKWANQRHKWNSGKIVSIKNTKDINSNKIQPNFVQAKNLATEPKTDVNNKQIEFNKIDISTLEKSNFVINFGEKIQVDIEIKSKINDNDLTIGIAIYNKDRILVYGTNNFIQNKKINCKSNEKTKINISFTPTVPQGFYSVTLALHKGRDHTQCCYEWIDDAFIFGILGQPEKQFEGTTDCNAVFVVDNNNV